MKAIGPAHIYLVTDLATGEGVKISDMESVSFDPGTQMLGTTNAFTGDAWSEDGIYSLAPAPTVQAELYATDLDTIAAMILGGEAFEGAFGLGQAGLKKIAPSAIPSLFVLPAFDEAAGVESQYGIWLPAVAVESLASIVYNRPTAGGNANAYTASFKGARRQTMGGVALPAAAQFGFIGSPSDVTGAPVTWQLPA